MKVKFLFLCLTICFSSLTALAQEASWPPSLEGRWDLTLQSDGKYFPAWLEVRHSGVSTLVGRVMLVGGSARPIAKINYDNGKFNFSIPTQWDRSPLDVQMTGTITGDTLLGSLNQSNGKAYSWVGVRAPSLKREKAPEWAAPITLFNGKDLSGWHTEGANQWI